MNSYHLNELRGGFFSLNILSPNFGGSCSRPGLLSIWTATTCSIMVIHSIILGSKREMMATHRVLAEFLQLRDF